MGKEIERKFLVVDEQWRAADGTKYRQGYLSTDKERTVRVRIAGNKAMLTIKGITQGASRAEYEYEIPVEDAEELLDLCQRPIIEKWRHEIEHAGMTWEVDEFFGDNQGLVLAEVELDSPDEAFDLPPWVGKEVTDDPRYFNANLVHHPFRNWP